MSNAIQAKKKEKEMIEFEWMNGIELNAYSVLLKQIL